MAEGGLVEGATTVSEGRKRAVFVTGGTGSVGRSLVAGFARRGDRVLFQYHRSVAMARRLTEEFGATGIEADLAVPDRLGNGDVDILINCAAINETNDLAGDVRLADWNRAIAINLTAPFVFIQQCLPYMMRQKWGRIVNVSSIYGLRGVETNLPYTVSKHGLSGVTKTVAREYGAYGITCNEICPGPIRSRLLERVCADRAAANGVDLEEYMREVEEEIPSGKLVEASSVAEMALFLTSEAGESVNGASIVIDGGMIA